MSDFTRRLTAETPTSASLRDCSLLLVVTCVIYLPLLGLPAWSGNEPLRVIAAREMLTTGHWAIPVIHGKPYLVKPPLMSWLIAAGGWTFGGVTEWTARFPSVIAAFLTALSAYFFAEGWLGRTGRFFAAVAILSMAALMKKASSAEIDTLLIFLVALSLLTWFQGYQKRWNPVVLWSLPLAVVGVSSLTKGPQGAAYFYLTVIPYLLMRRQLAVLFSWAHVVGIFVCLMVPAGYLIFVLQETTLSEYSRMWGSQVTKRAGGGSLLFLKHFFEYPFRVVLSFLPWSLFAFPPLSLRGLRGHFRSVLSNELMAFSLAMFCFNGSLYWLLPSAHHRYFLPVGPFAALMLGGLFEHYVDQAKGDARVLSFFQRALLALSWAALIIAVATLPLVVILKWGSVPGAGMFAACLAGLAVLVIVRMRTLDLEKVPLLIALAAGLVFLVERDLDVGRLTLRGDYPKKVAAEINAMIPAGVPVVYEVGFDRFLDVTSYLATPVVMVDRMSDLKPLREKEGSVCFLFDAKMLRKSPQDEQREWAAEIGWKKISSRKIDRGTNELILGCMEERATPQGREAIP